MRGGGKLHDAVEGRADEIGELHLDHRPQAHQRHAGGHAREAQLGDRRVDHPPRAKLLLEALGDLERAAEIAGDILTQQQHLRVTPHLLAQGLADGRDVGQDAAFAALICLGEAKILCSVHVVHSAP